MGLFSGLGRMLAGSPPPDKALAAAIARAVDAVDPLLKTVSAYERRLAPVAVAALDHCASLAAEVPGPLDIDPQSFGSDPMVRAMFATPDDLVAMLGRSRAVREMFGGGGPLGVDTCYGLLGMRQRVKAVSGTVVRGEVVQHDVPQRLLYFTTHTLNILAPGHAALRERLREVAFDSVVGGFAAELAGRRRERDEARTAASLGRGAHREQAEALAARHAAAVAALAPERLLADFAAWLGEAPRHIYLKPSEVSVDLMGVIRDAPDPEATTLSLPELHSRDRRHWLVVVVRIRREDALDALRRQEEATRYLLI